MAKKVKILFLTDPTRPAESRMLKGFPEPAAMSLMLRDLMAAQLEWMVEGKLEFVTAGTNPALGLGRFYEAAGIEMTVENWASLNVNLPEIGSDLADEFDVDLVIAYEIPISMKEWFSHRNIPFLELSAHPVRFLKDALLGIDMGIADPFEVLNEASVDRLTISMEAGYLKAFMRTPARASVFPKGSSMFIGQKAIDRAMITKDGGFLSGQSLAKKMAAAIPDDVGPMFLKLHPLDKGENDAVVLLRDLAEIVGDFTGNIYSALASDDLERIVTVSSSVGLEARFFGKDVSYVSGPSVPVTFRDELTKPGHWQTVSNRFFEPEFLALLLSDALPIRRSVLTRAKFSHSSEMLPNRLRNMFNAYYGYSFISNDPIVENSKLAEVATHRKAIVSASAENSDRFDRLKKDHDRLARECRGVVSGGLKARLAWLLGRRKA